MRNLKKIIAAMSVAAIAMTSTAFAASTTKATYDSTTNKVALTLAQDDISATSGQMTVVVVPKTFGSGSQTDEELANEIYYINQEEFGEKFTAILADMGLKGTITPASYEVRIGGDNLSEVVTFDIEAKGGEVTITYGDADANGTVEIDDALLILKYKAGWTSVANTINLDNADADANGAVEIDDALLVLKYKAGWTSVTLGPKN